MAISPDCRPATTAPVGTSGEIYIAPNGAIRQAFGPLSGPMIGLPEIACLVTGHFVGNILGRWSRHVSRRHRQSVRAQESRGTGRSLRTLASSRRPVGRGARNRFRSRLARDRRATPSAGQPSRQRRRRWGAALADQRDAGHRKATRVGGRHSYPPTADPSTSSPARRECAGAPTRFCTPSPRRRRQTDDRRKSELDTLELRGETRDGTTFHRIGFALAAGGVGNRFFDKYDEYHDPGRVTMARVIGRAVADYATIPAVDETTVGRPLVHPDPTPTSSSTDGRSPPTRTTRCTRARST